MMHYRRYLIYIAVIFFLFGGCQGENGARQTETASAPTSQAASPPAAHLPAPVLKPQPEEFQTLVAPTRPPRTLELVSVAVTEVPTIDGKAHESIWDTAPAVTTLDFASQRPIRLQSAYTDESIFFLVSYADTAPSETQKSWGWDSNEGIYKQMSDREDVFVMKWNLEDRPVNLAMHHAEPHRADIWFWKARRTNLLGYADDKWHLVSSEASQGAKAFPSLDGGTLYLSRIADTGRAAYEAKLIYDYHGPMVSQYYPRQPEGSRADIRAKGAWQEGRWTIEWARKLRTGYDDDIAFAPGGSYDFAVSCYEMAASEVHPEWSQPLYKAGDAFDRLRLRVATGDERVAGRER